MGNGTIEAALHSVGSCTSALDSLMNNEFNNAFIAARPPGHHAEQRKGMGFCFFNNIAITALRAAEVHQDRKSTRLNSSHVRISYAVFCLKKKKKIIHTS